MKTKSCVVIDPKKSHAGQNAKLGLISVTDLSLLTGIDTARLTSYAKKGFLRHYGEYHGKRFYNFNEIVAWLCQPEAEGEVKLEMRKALEEELHSQTCPYFLERFVDETNGATSVRVVWKDLGDEEKAA